MAAQLRRNVRGIAADIDRRLSILVQLDTAGIRPDDYDETASLGLLRVCPDLLVHFKAMRGAGIDREPDADAAQSQGIRDAAGKRLVGIFFVVQHIMVVDFEDQRNLSRIFSGARFQKPQRGRIGVTAGLDG